MPLVAHPVRSLWGSQPRCARCVCEWLHRKWDGALVVPCNTRYLYPHDDEAGWVHHDTAYSLNRWDSISHFLGKAFEREDIHISPPSIGGGYEIKLGSVIQQTGGKFPIDDSFTEVFGTYPPLKGVRV